MMSRSLNMDSPFPRRLWSWIMERFEPPKWIAFAIIYLCCSLLGQASVAGPNIGTIHIGSRELLGCLASIAFFLLLRILDEHKDYAKDSINHPQRVLQRGLITLRHLKILAVVCFACIGAFCLYADRGFGPAGAGFLIVIVWVSLMTKEFFVPEWLNQRLVLYAVSHMLVMPLVILWFVMSAIPDFELSMTLLWLAALSFFGGLCFELTRKTKGIEEEQTGVETYSGLLGRKRSSLIAWAMGCLELLCKYFLILSLPVRGKVLPYGIAFAGLALILGLAFWLYLREPNAKGRKRNEAAAALLAIGSYGGVLLYIYLNFTIVCGF